MLKAHDEVLFETEGGLMEGRVLSVQRGMVEVEFFVLEDGVSEQVIVDMSEIAARRVGAKWRALPARGDFYASYSQEEGD